jgi:putative flippase GtrA
MAGLAAIVDIGGFGVLRAISTPVVAAAVISFLMATGVNFVLTSKIVFKATISGRRYILFLTGSMLGLTINVWITATVVGSLDVPSVVAKTIGAGIAFSFNFLVAAKLIFRGNWQ